MGSGTLSPAALSLVLRISIRISIIVSRPQGGFMEWKKSIKVFKAKLKT